MFPIENRRDFTKLPTEVVDTLQIDLYRDPAKAVFKALADT